MTRTMQQKTTTGDVPDARPRATKVDTLRRLLSRKAGADLEALCGATGWQAHSVRAALSGLRKAGFTIDRTASRTEGGVAVYRITGRPELPK
ncbi:MAG: DUF3489 domain-containing protein [Paracoccaceae bacterium]